MMGQSEIRETLEKADELVTELKAFRNLSPESGNATSVTISAGGVGVWIASTACFVMLAMMILGALWVSREFSRMDARAAEQEVKIDRANTFLSAIWANAPELEKKVKAEQEKQ